MNQKYDWAPAEPDTTVAVLRRAAAKWGERPFLDVLGEIYSFADIDRESTRMAHGLSALGVRQGHCVMTVLDNNVESVLTWFAINKLGAIAVPTNTAFKGEFLRHQAADAGAAVIIAESDYADRVIEVEEGLPEARVLVFRGEKPTKASTSLKVISIGEVYVDSTDDINVEVKHTDIAMLVYTGGTTGPSKGCANSHNYLCGLARQAQIMGGRNEESINWTPLPMFHQNASVTSVLCLMTVGGRVAMYPRFSVSNFWPEIERTGANDVNLLGSMIPLLAHAPDNESSKRCVGQIRYLGAAPFPPELQQIWKERFGVQTASAPGYGLTEATMITLQKFGDYAAPGSSGKRNEWFDVRIVDDNERELPPGTAGEVIVRPLKPHCMFEGYWRRPADTLAVLRNMWFHTGDIGKFDDEGFFYFVDRKKDYLRRRGENISSYEMETTFRAHPAIEDVAVHAVPSDMTEDDVKVTAIVRPGMELTEEDLCQWSIDRLPYFAVPRYIEFRAQLPRNPVGRVLKYELRDQGVTPSTWDRETSTIQLKKR